MVAKTKSKKRIKSGSAPAVGEQAEMRRPKISLPFRIIENASGQIETFTIELTDYLSDLIYRESVSIFLNQKRTYLSHIVNNIDELNRINEVCKTYCESDNDISNIRDAKLIQQLVDYISTLKNNFEERIKIRISNSEILFTDIPSIFKIGCDVLYLDREEKHAGRIESVTLAESFNTFYKIDIIFFYYHQDNFIQYKKSLYIDEYLNCKKLNSFEFHLLKEEDKHLLELRGMQYLKLTKNSNLFKNAGIAFKTTSRFASYYEITEYSKIYDISRCMIDFYAYSIMCEDSQENKYHSDKKAPTLSSEYLHLLPAFVPGYSLTKRIWLKYSIKNLSSVQWNDSIISKLVLDEKIKSTIISLVSRSENEFNDFIEGKGGGSVFLLSGPPGTGKTFTAEVVAEFNHLPLLKISLQDLGTDADVLERKLEELFFVGQNWNAVILLDEADVFLEKRSNNDLQRNAIVAAFLRHIEYFTGILFLTTNMNQEKLDPAVMSRVLYPVIFEKFEDDQSLLVWKTILNELNIKIDTKQYIGGSKLEILANLSKNLNGSGRKIKNVVRAAMKIANSKNRSVEFEDLQNLLIYFNKFEETNIVDNNK